MYRVVHHDPARVPGGGRWVAAVGREGCADQGNAVAVRAGFSSPGGSAVLRGGCRRAPSSTCDGGDGLMHTVGIR
jgi:hypothetical protein